MYIENEDARLRHEEEILFEKPYSWKKHLIFQLPDIFIFAGKVVLALVGIQLIGSAFLGAMTQVLMQEMPDWCSLLK